MTWQEKFLLKRSLIVAGLWEEEQAGNPTSDDAAAGLLLQKMEKMLGRGSYLLFPRATPASELNEVRVMWDGMTSVLARDGDLHVAICRAALELPAFLDRHPECRPNAGVDFRKR
jgi:hypothetical protein